MGRKTVPFPGEPEHLRALHFASESTLALSQLIQTPDNKNRNPECPSGEMLNPMHHL